MESEKGLAEGDEIRFSHYGQATKAVVIGVDHARPKPYKVHIQQEHKMASRLWIGADKVLEKIR